MRDTHILPVSWNVATDETVAPYSRLYGRRKTANRLQVGPRTTPRSVVPFDTTHPASHGNYCNGGETPDRTAAVRWLRTSTSTKKSPRETRGGGVGGDSLYPIFDATVAANRLSADLL
jgi:hypothetical protein